MEYIMQLYLKFWKLKHICLPIRAILILSSLFVISPHIYSQYSETLYGVEEGLTNSSVIDITEDENGFIWVFTAQGVCRFDGHSFKEYKAQVENYNRTITFLGRFLNDSKGRIWIESSLPAILMYDNKHDKISICQSIRYHDFYDLAEHKEDEFLVTSWSKIFHYTERDEYVFDVQTIDLPEETGSILHWHQFNSGKILAFSQKGAFHLKLEDDTLLLNRVKLLNSADNTDFQTDLNTDIVECNHKFYLLKGNELFRTNIKYDGTTPDSVINVELLDIHFPEIGLFRGDRLFAVIPGDGDKLFIRGVNGIYLYNTLSGEAEIVKSEPYGFNDASLGDFRTALYYDSRGILWAGTDQGLLKIMKGNKAFHSILPHPENPTGLRTAKIQSVAIDQRDNLWIGSVSGGLYHAAPDSNGTYTNFTNYLPVPGDPNSLHGSTIINLFLDSKERLWVAADNIQWMDLDNPGVFHYPMASSYAAQIGEGLYPSEIAEDSNGNIMVLSRSSPSWIILPDGRESYRILLDSVRNKCKWPSIKITSDDETYMYSDCRLYQLKSGWSFINEDTPYYPGDSLWYDYYSNRALVPWAYPAKMDTLINYDSIHYLMAYFLIDERPEKNELWITMDFMYKMIYCDLDQVKTMARKPMEDRKLEYSFFPSESDDLLEYIFEVFQDQGGDIWATTWDGLMRIDPQTKTYNTYFKDDGLPTNRFYWGKAIDKDGNIFLGTNNGLVYFHPDSITNDLPADVYISDIRLAYQTVVADSGSFLQQSILFQDNLKLKHNQNFIGFQFSAFDYRNSEKIKYKYMLTGVDEDWVFSENRRFVDYPDLRPGRYTFRVIAANGNGIWNKEGAALDILIQQPLWFRWWAILSEFLLFLTLMVLFIRDREKNLKSRAIMLESKVEEKTHEILQQRKEVDELKNRFYTNISHEFRTPLTLLVGPIEDSLKSKDKDAGISRNILRIMLRNARRLQRLINQLLDISKLESGKMELQLVKANLADFTRTISSSFLSLAESNGIKYMIEVDNLDEEVCFDADKLEKIITNLLSNAFKFSQVGGKVSIYLKVESSSESEEEKQAKITVSDTGRGMEPEQLDRIFDRFYQVSDSDTRDVEGTGIGLALTKELVEFMHGEIDVESTVGKGTSFSITFPVSESYYSELEIAEMQMKEMIISDLERDFDEPIVKETSLEKEGAEELLLVVEDNPDLRKYISDQFSGIYRVIDSKNGKSGFEKAVKEIPDLIITDLMMPVMGGMEMCKKLKEHPVTNHIPVIMLTAKADKESKLEGLEAAADDYIIKPFDSEELLVRSKNLIKQRKELRKNFEKSFLQEHDETEAVSKQFKMLRDFMRVFDDHMADAEITVEDYAEKLNMSRSQLFRKINAVSGTTPNELIRMVRMKRAASLLRSSDLNVTQVMYQVGMKNPSYFAKSFKKYFGVNPRDYQNGK